MSEHEHEDAALRAEDERARVLAQREFVRPLVLEAGAGTGKTTVLTARVLAWAIGPGWEKARAALAEQGARDAERFERIAERTLGGVVAITFTEAAAAEMAVRITDGLQSIAEGEEPRGLDPQALTAAGTEAAQRADALRGALDHLVVRTIHAWCRSLLAEYPIAAGVHPDFEVDATARAQGEVVGEVLEENLRAAYATRTDSPLLALAEAGLGASAVYDALSMLVDEGVRAEDLAYDPLAPERVTAWLEEFRHAAQEMVELAVGPEFASGVSADVAGLAGRSVSRLDAFAVDGGELEALCTDLDALWESRKGYLRNWAWGKFNTKALKAWEHRDELSRVSARLRIAVGTAGGLQPGLLREVHSALSVLVGDVEERMRKRGAVTYAGLLRGARDLMRDRPAIAAAVRGRLDQLLVDEFQDTDAIQCDLVRAIALQGDEEERPGLFVVGDPKQSIYAWRGADLAAYRDFVEALCTAGGEQLPLCVNFRSVPAVLSEVRRCIEPVMHAEAGVQPVFQPLFACSEKSEASGYCAGESAAVEHWVSWQSGERDGLARTKGWAATELEARAFAADVRRLHESGVGYCEVALLLRARGDFDVYLEALRDAGVPYAVTGERTFYQRREVIEATAALRCVLDRNDHLALLALLRSSVVGVPDAALIPLWARDLPEHAGKLFGQESTELEGLLRNVSEVAASLPEAPGLGRVAGWDRNLAAVLCALGPLRLSFEQDPPDVFVEKMRTALLAEATESGRFPAAFRVANLERFYREVAHELAAGVDELALLRRLRTVGERERDADEPVASVEDAVQVSTVHGAKGLGFEHVYFAQVNKKGRGSRSTGVALREGNAEYGLLGVKTLGFEAAAARQERIEVAEQVRLFYVALTRAKQRLVVMGSRPDKEEPVAAEHARTAAELLTGRAGGPSYSELVDGMEVARQAGARGFSAADGTRWYYPDLDERSPEVASVPAHEAMDLEAAAAEASRLALQRAEASARMARPLQATASADGHAHLREQEAEARFETAPPERGGASSSGLDRASAMRVGTAVHALLESWDLGAPVDEELVRQRARLPAALAGLGVPDDDSLVEEATTILEAFSQTALFDRFVELGDRVIARELPVWLPPEPDAALEAAEIEAAPLHFTAGAIDLVYRDEDGSLVVVDYKTDQVEGEALEQRAMEYAAQGRHYVRALEEGLGLDAAPRFELWFLRSGRTLSVPL